MAIGKVFLRTFRGAIATLAPGAAVAVMTFFRIIGGRGVSHTAIVVFERDSEGKHCNFMNHYECCCTGEWDGSEECLEQGNSAKGPTVWEDAWSCACDDECPKCGAAISPAYSDVTDPTTGEVDRQAWGFTPNA